MKNRIALLITIFILVIGLVITIVYFSTTHSVTFHYTNVHAVQIIDTTQKNKVIATIQKSGDSTRLSSKGSYEVVYKGDTKYADGTLGLTASTSSVSIKPDYSQSTYQTLITSNTAAINIAIINQYPKTNTLYTIQTGIMYSYGEWYVAKLHYNGDYDFNSDNLKIILHQQKGTWSLATKPDILFTKYDYPNIPHIILSSANKL